MKKLPIYKVLLAEDFEPSRIVISEILDSLGYEYKTVKNGSEAFLAMKYNNFDLILMDIQMPELNGFEATELIRRTLPYPKNAVPIIVMTGWEYVSELKNTYKDEGFDALLTKPFSIERLVEVLSMLLDDKKQEKA